MNKERLGRLPKILEKYKDRISVDIHSGRLVGLKPEINHKGYLTINFWYEDRKAYYRLHEIIAFLGGLDLLDKTVNHINGEKTDNRIVNLETISAKENHEKAGQLGLFPTGERNHATKLSDEEVINILSEYTGAWGQQTSLAKKYGVSQSTISRIIKGERRNTHRMVRK